MKKESVAIIAPVHIQPSSRWIGALRTAARDGHAEIIIVDDSDGRVALPKEWDAYDYARQKKALDAERFEEFQIFHKSSACKNFGVWLAWKKKFDVIMIIDSDCIVPKNFVAEHLRALRGTGDGWENPIEGTGWRSRGLPYHKRELPVALNMGLWTNELDISGLDRVRHGTPPKEPAAAGTKIAHGFVPLSGMNLAFRRELAPAMMFQPVFSHREHTFRRHDDIWGGYILQHAMRKMNEKLSYGVPFVYHDTIINPHEDAEDEKAVIAHEALFCDTVDAIFGPLAGNTYADLMQNFAREMNSLCRGPRRVFSALAPAFELWTDMFH